MPKRHWVVVCMGVLLLLAATNAVADPFDYTVIGTTYPSLSASFQVDLSASSLTIQVTNTSTIPGNISAFAFALPGTITAALDSISNSNFFLTNGNLGNVPQYNGTTLDFQIGNFSSFAGGTGNPCCSLLPGGSFLVVLSGSFGTLSEADFLNGTYVRFKSVGADGEGSDVAHEPIPEPASLALLGTGMAAAAALRKRFTLRK